MKEDIRNVKEVALNRMGRLGRRVDNSWLYWSVYHPFNFGDWIGPFLYEKMSGRDAWFTLPDNLDRKTVFMSAGSIMSKTRGNCIVWGSGIMNRNEAMQKPWSITAVRGPYTKERCDELKIPCPEVFGDPGILLPRYYEARRPTKVYQLGIIPHYSDLAYITEKFGNNPDVLIVDVRFPIEKVIDDIASCPFIISSSLHGLIVGNAYGIPSAWVGFGDNIAGDDIKFFDYYSSLGCFNPTKLTDAQELSIEELLDFAKNTPLLPTVMLSDKLLEACPFPGANDYS